MLRALVVLAWLIPGVACAQSMHDHDAGAHHMHAMGESGAAGRVPAEAGQSAFAAIQEIIQILEADPKTDWSKVDIEALRHHLIDMNNVTLNADVKRRAGRRRHALHRHRRGRRRNSIRRMASAHAATMNGVDGWRFDASRDRRRRRSDGHAFPPRTPTSCVGSASSAC